MSDLLQIARTEMHFEGSILFSRPRTTVKHFDTPFTAVAATVSVVSCIVGQ